METKDSDQTRSQTPVSPETNPSSRPQSTSTPECSSQGSQALPATHNSPIPTHSTGQHYGQPSPQPHPGAGWAYAGCMPSNNWHPQPPIGNYPQPRAMPTGASQSLQELRMEREYLAQNLQAQGRRAQHLCSRLEAARDQLLNAKSKAEAKKIRRQIRNLGKDLDTNTQQDNAALLRLNELSIEMQGRGHCEQVQRQMAAPQPCTFNTYHPPSHPSSSTQTSGYTQSPATPISPSSTSNLNPLSPAFVPGATPPQDVPCPGPLWGRGEEVEQSTSGGVAAGPSLQETTAQDSIAQETVEDARVEDETITPSLEWEYVHWTSDEPDGFHGLPLRSRRMLSQRRFSLPCLQSVWPGTSIGAG